MVYTGMLKLNTQMLRGQSLGVFSCGCPLANHPGERYFDLLAKRTIFIPEICIKLPIDFFPKL